MGAAILDLYSITVKRWSHARRQGSQDFPDIVGPLREFDLKEEFQYQVLTDLAASHQRSKSAHPETSLPMCKDGSLPGRP